MNILLKLSEGVPELEKRMFAKVNQTSLSSADIK